VLYRSFYCAGINLDAKWFQRETIPKVDARSLAPKDFVQRFEQQSRPVLLEGCSTSWPAFRSWSRESLLERFGDATFTCGPCDWPLREFYAYAERNNDEAPLFVFDRLFHQRAPALMDDYEVPELFRGRDLFDLLGDSRPAFRWLLVGNRRSGSKWHVDPNKTCAWNAVVRGRKRWLLLPPGCPPPGVHPSKDGDVVTQPLSIVEWFANFYAELRSIVDKNPSWNLLEGTCGPGDAIFVPCGWWHCVLNLEDDTFAVTQNYASETHVHSVRRFLREKREQVSGTKLKSTLAELFDEALSRERPDLLNGDGISVAEGSRGVDARQEGTVGAAVCEGTAATDAPPAPAAASSFSFWDHLRSTGKSLGFNADAAAKDAAPAPQQQGDVRETSGAPSQKRRRCATDVALADSRRV